MESWRRRASHPESQRVWNSKLGGDRQIHAGKTWQTVSRKMAQCAQPRHRQERMDEGRRRVYPQNVSWVGVKMGPILKNGALARQNSKPNQKPVLPKPQRQKFKQNCLQRLFKWTLSDFKTISQIRNEINSKSAVITVRNRNWIWILWSLLKRFDLTSESWKSKQSDGIGKLTFSLLSDSGENGLVRPQLW